jgi:uncharacterized protein (TIGR03437 family)
MAVLLAVQPARAAEGDALAILANIQARHLPYGAILDPIFALTDSDQIADYTRCGDSALWTGHYLAAEAFRYKVTQAPDALAHVASAVASLKGLADVTGTNLLARCMVPAGSPYAASISTQEAANGIYTNNSPPGWIWVGNTSRDEYSGALFGLSVAYDMVTDATIKASISDLVTRLVDFLNGNNWSVVMPNGSASTSFLIRPDEIEAFLAIGRQVNDSHFSSIGYETQRDLLAPTVPVPILVDTASDDSYFKFNLDYINLYNLVRLENSSAKSIYQSAYGQLRGYTSADQNAFFNIIDLALNGTNAARDHETLALLDGWLLRLRRDFNVDLTNTVPVCASQACKPVPVWLRPNTDFLWQRSPYVLTATGGAGIIETAGIDYILPYWMARYYGLQEPTVVGSSAASVSVVAPGSLGSIYGANLAAATQQATSLPLPASLGGVSITVTDAAGNSGAASLLYVSPGQINFQMPTGMATGVAIFTINGTATPVTAMGAVGQVGPTLYSMTGTGSGPAAATALSISGGNPSTTSVVPLFNCGSLPCQALPIDLSGSAPVYLTLYATGVRNRSSLDNVLVTINGISLPALYAGPQPSFAGLDQINVQLPRQLSGSGVSNVVVKVDQHQANTVTVDIR